MMNSECRKDVARAIHALDQAQAKLTEMIHLSDSLIDNADEKFANLLDCFRRVGIEDPKTEESKESKEWLSSTLTKDPQALRMVAAFAYCGLMQATLALPKFQDE